MVCVQDFCDLCVLGKDKQVLCQVKAQSLGTTAMVLRRGKHRMASRCEPYACLDVIEYMHQE